MLNPPISIKVSLEGLKTIHALAGIASKAHSNNPSPVDIKKELADLNAEMLFQLEEDTAKLIVDNKPTQP